MMRPRDRRRASSSRPLGSWSASAANGEADQEGRYRVYHEFRAALRAVQPHQWLALQRGSADGSLKVRMETPDGKIVSDIAAAWIRTPGTPAAEQVRLAIEDSYDRLLRPAVERELGGQLSEFSDDHAITVFAANLRNLLLQPPLRERGVMGIDPGFRTGCKVATVDATGKLLHTVTIYPHEPRHERARSLHILTGLVELDRISVIAIGNGTASRETEALVAELIQTAPQPPNSGGSSSPHGGGAGGPRISLTSWSARRARRSIRLLIAPAPSSPTWMSPCVARSRLLGACKTRWPSWSRLTRRASAWACISMM